MKEIVDAITAKYFEKIFRSFFSNLIFQPNCFSIYDLTVPTMEMIAFFEAHESDIMCMEYSDPQSGEFLL